MRHYCGWWLVVGSLLGVASVAAAQPAAIEGQVTSADGQLLDAAVVEVHSGSGAVQVVVADDDGRFSFPAVEPGDIRLLASRSGYRPLERTLVLEPRQPIVLTVELLSDAVVTEAVTVTATPPPVDPQSTGSSRVLTRQGLGSVTTPTAADIPTLAEYELPGAMIGHDNFVHVRGNELSLHQFINGVSFLDNAHRHFTPGLSPQIFDTVNLMSGGFPAEFGNRFGGILDVTTRSGRSLDGHGSATLGFGTIESRDGSADYGGSAGRWGYYVFGGSQHAGRFLNPPEPDERHAAGHTTQAVAQVDYQGDRSQLKIFVSGGDSRFELPNTQLQEADGRDARRELQSATGILRWQHIVSNSSLLSASFYTRRVSDDLLPTADLHTTFADGTRQTRTLGGKVDWFQSLGGHRLKAGVDASGYHLREGLAFAPRPAVEDDHHADEADDHGDPHLDRLRGALSGETGLAIGQLGNGAEGHHDRLNGFLFAGRDTMELLSAYAQDRFNPGANLTIDLGLRIDHLTMVESHTQVSPRVGLAYHVRSGSVVRLAYNRLFTPPPIEYLLLANFLGGTAEGAGDRTGHVKPYTQHHVEGGLSQQLHRDVIVDVTAYRHEGDHAFETSEISDTRLFVPTNFAEARASGLEIGVDYRQAAVTGISGRVQYALAKVEFVGPVAGGLAAESHGAGEVIPPAFDQRHTFVSNVQYRRPWRSVAIGAVARYGSGTPSELPHGEGVPAAFRYLPDHWTFDVSARANLWRRGDRRIALEMSVRNLTNNIYAVAKESEATPLQYAMRRVIGGRVRFDF